MKSIVLSATSIKMPSNVILTWPENDWKSFRVISSFRKSWCNFLLKIWRIFLIGLTFGLHDWIFRTFNFLTSSSSFCNILWGHTILQKQFPIRVDRLFKHDSKVVTTKKEKLIFINSNVILLYYNSNFPVSYCL